ncbi:MBL fold metallo-hydrolase [Anaerolentibacter hominis]|uniref:MBL fold metallo-hydrolase n=1 Tax=Anaerolentibacter hominis TaxID=3079009 RepID=UPI0031B80152
MKLKVLVDNSTYVGKYYQGEPGLSYYIQDGGFSMLWDMGYSDLFLKNANAFGIDLSRIDAAAFSHSHSDHTGGFSAFTALDYTRGLPVYAHPDVFGVKLVQGEKRISPVWKEYENGRLSLRLSREPKQISEHLLFLGEIPSSNDFETRKQFDEKLGETGPEPDYMMDDTALVYQDARGIYIITACSHSGICNIIQYARELCKGPVLGLIGGFHLLDMDEQTERTIDFLERESIPQLYPCHCTTFPVRAALSSRMPVQDVYVSTEIEW